MAGAVLCDRAHTITPLPVSITTDDDNQDEDRLKEQEQAIMTLANKYHKDGNMQQLADLIRGARPFLGAVSKAKAAKVVRALVEMFLDMDTDDKGNTIQVRVQLCKECIDWAKGEKRTFLRQSLEARLIALFYDAAMYAEALALGSALLKELKKLDDKNLLVEVQLLESKTYHALANLSKSRAALTSARTTANSVYCPPRVQAALDLQSGVLHAADERDFKTAYSYFYEAFEGYDSSDTEKAPVALKYMLLSKIMLNQPEDVYHIIGGKLALKYAGSDIDAMKAVAKAAKERSLADFQRCLTEYAKELEEDPVVKAHLGTLYDSMLEQNLCRIVEPYSRVEVEYVSSRIRLPVPQVEKKLSQMILDKKFNGILDQGEGVLIVFEEAVVDRTYETALETIHHMSKVVDTLYQKAKKLS